MLPFLLILYAPLLLKGVFFGTRLERAIKGLPALVGRLEYFIAPWRDTLVALGLAGYFVYQLGRREFPPYFWVYPLLALLSLINRLQRSRFRLRLCRWLLKWDNVEPRQFFSIYYRSLGSFSDQIPPAAKQVSFSLADYRKTKDPRRTITPLLIGSVKTATLAKLAIFAMEKIEGQEGIDTFDALARLWGVTFLACARLKMKTEGLEKLPPLNDKVLLVFNHKSYLDFALNFFALGDLRNRGRHLRPRFIAAKDHFIDNPFIYSWLGVGKCIEKAGMIFINRKKGKGWLAMKEAAEKMSQADVEVAVYPQGTRAWGLKDESGERIDAGYYTTVSRKTLNDPRGHLKKGTAQLILDAALKLKEKNEPPLKILFVGIDGTATVGPKGSFKMQTESEITFRLGGLWTVKLDPALAFENPGGLDPANEAQENYVAELEAIQAQLDREMEKSIQRHRTLAHRVIRDPRILKEYKDRLEIFLNRADGTENTLPFAVLDRIYALPSARWKNHLQHFAQLAIKEGDPGPEWENFSREVALELIKK